VYYWRYEAHIKGGKDIAKLVQNPSLSARPRSKKVSRNRYLLFLYLWRKFTCRRRCGNKMGGLPLFAQCACKGPCSEQKGWALSGATIGSVVANPSLSARSQCRTDDESHQFCFFIHLSELDCTPGHQKQKRPLHVFLRHEHAIIPITSRRGEASNGAIQSEGLKPCQNRF
jgi:hypothetical protein